MQIVKAFCACRKSTILIIHNIMRANCKTASAHYANYTTAQMHLN
ncbi:hypothetical protein GVAMD_0263 [Gardnerella vaginalis AMD]|nr:hypothetical protein GVAMD_0263 [Gardnerella vaginalis AMD]